MIGDRARTKLTKKIAFVNIGGNHRMADGTIIKKGERFMSCPEDIPEAFRDKLKPVDAAAVQQAAAEAGVAIIYTSRERATPGIFDIVDPNGKVVSEKGLTEAEADEVLSRLNT